MKKNTNCPKQGKQKKAGSVTSVTSMDNGEWDAGRCIYRHDDTCMFSSCHRSGMRLCVSHQGEPK